MKKARKLSAVLLALVMVFALSVSAFAAEQDTVQVTVTINGEVYQAFSYDITDGTTVYDVVEGKYGDDANWTSDGSYLTGLLGYSSAPYLAKEGTFVYNDETGYDEYVGGDPEIDEYNQDPDVIAYGGIYASYESWGMPGYYLLGDEQHMIYIGSDWLYQVDYAADGYGNPVYPPNSTDLDDDQYQYTMKECELSDGDLVYLIYGTTSVVF